MDYKKARNVGIAVLVFIVLSGMAVWAGVHTGWDWENTPSTLYYRFQKKGRYAVPAHMQENIREAARKWNAAATGWRLEERDMSEHIFIWYAPIDGKGGVFAQTTFARRMTCDGLDVYYRATIEFDSSEKWGQRGAIPSIPS